MSEDLREPAGVQYNEWVGTFAADGVDMRDLEEFIGVDGAKWSLIVVDIHIYGGSQTIIGYAIPALDRAYKELEKQIVERGRIEVTRVAEIRFRPEAGHWDTNPPRPLSTPILGVGELLTYGFKRLQLRLLNIQHGLDELPFEIIEVASVVSDDLDEDD